jgi:hypothetical protein
MTRGVRDLYEDPGDELHRVDPLGFGRLGLVVSPLGHVDDLVRAGGEAQPGEADRGSHHVAGERLEVASIARMHEDPVGRAGRCPVLPWPYRAIVMLRGVSAPATSRTNTAIRFPRRHVTQARAEQSAYGSLRLEYADDLP